MARRNRVREELLSQVERKRAAAAKKISRYENMGTPVHLRGTNLDPRGDLSEIRSANVRELRQRLAALETFVSRDTQFVPGRQGVPIPRGLWRQYEAVEKQRNLNAKALEETIGNLQIPGAGLTVAERLLNITPVKNRTAADNTRVTFDEIHRVSTDVTGPGAVQRFIESMNKKFSADDISKKMKDQRAFLKEALLASKDKETLKIVNDLTDFQLSNLLDYTAFSNAVSNRWAQDSKGSRRNPKNQGNQDYGTEILSLAQWAKTLPESADDLTNPTTDKSQPRHARSSQRAKKRR